MSEPEVTDEVIREAIRRAEKAICPPTDQRGYAFP
jgi:hypothetical protein